MEGPPTSALRFYQHRARVETMNSARQARIATAESVFLIARKTCFVQTAPTAIAEVAAHWGPRTMLGWVA